MWDYKDTKIYTQDKTAEWRFILECLENHLQVLKVLVMDPSGTHLECKSMWEDALYHRDMSQCLEHLLRMTLKWFTCSPRWAELYDDPRGFRL